MTKIECLEKMVLVWRYLEEHPGEDAKKAAYSALNLPYELHYCPCCAYVDQFPSKKAYSCLNHNGREVINCDLCPLKGLWNDKWGDNFHCEVGGSAYRRWQYLAQKDSKAAARKIADYSEQLLSELKGR